MKVFGLMATTEVSGRPCRGLFQLVKEAQKSEVRNYTCFSQPS
jgi:hypothetical protein